MKAIEVRAVSALFVKDRELMRLWRSASQAAQVEAVTVEERNYAVIHDEALLSYLRARYPTIDLLDFDPKSRTVS